MVEKGFPACSPGRTGNIIRNIPGKCKGVAKENSKLQDFETDFIGTDLVSYNVYQRPLFSMVNMMNVYLNLGFGLEELIKKVTVNPAETMKMNGITDTVKEGSSADLFLFKIKEKRTVMKDNHGGEIEAEKMIVPVMTVKDGSVLYRNIEY